MLRKLKRQAQAWRHGGRMDQQLETELQFHIDLETRRLVNQGIGPDEDRRRARA
jgi:hypothetical protein